MLSAAALRRPALSELLTGPSSVGWEIGVFIPAALVAVGLVTTVVLLEVLGCRRK
jgi:hypothetical protein